MVRDMQLSCFSVRCVHDNTTYLANHVMASNLDPVPLMSWTYTYSSNASAWLAHVLTVCFQDSASPCGMGLLGSPTR